MVESKRAVRAKNQYGVKLPKGWRQLGRYVDGTHTGVIEAYCGDCAFDPYVGASYCTCGKPAPGARTGAQVPGSGVKTGQQ